MHILVAPDSFKETLTAAAAAEAIAAGIRRIGSAITIDLCPIADGGEGTVRTMMAATNGDLHQSRITGPLGWPVMAEWGTFKTDSSSSPTAVIEIAAAAGLHLIPLPQRDPTRTTTYGVGQLISRAVEAGCAPIIIGLGGSATCDGGCGMAQALGCCLTLEDGSVAGEPLTGSHLSRITSVDRNTIPIEFRDGWRLRVACDVTNPLFGPRGSAAVYGPQKGASPEQVRLLDAGLRHLASLLPDVDPDFSGAGSAGGLGFGFRAFCNARIERGIDIVLRALDFQERAARADLIITGEGCIDAQTMDGKAVHGVAEVACATDTPIIGLAGTIGSGAEQTISESADVRLTSYHGLTTDLGLTRDQAMQAPAHYLSDLAERIVLKRLRTHSS